MKKNALPRTTTLLFALGDDMSDALVDYEAPIGIKQNTKVALDADLQAAKDAELDFPKKAKIEDDALSVRNIANSNAKGFIFLSKRQLTDDFGSEPSSAWETVGFKAGSLKVPDDIPGRIKILDGIADYLKDNPGKEIAGKNFTQAKARALSKSLGDARTALNIAVGNRSTAKGLRDKAIKNLRKRMIGLIKELGQLLEADADEWYFFGLVPPAGAQTPAIPDGVNGHQVGPTAAMFAWPHTPRADKYRPFKQVVGVDPQPVPLKLTRETDVLLEKLPPLATVKFFVQSYNAAGDSAPSEVATITLI